jgi:hypothetical protein
MLCDRVGHTPIPQPLLPVYRAVFLMPHAHCRVF